MDIQKKFQPWLCGASGKLISDVSIFIEFLQGSLKNFESLQESLLVSRKLKRLLRWRETAKTIISLSSVDDFHLSVSNFQVSSLGNHTVFIPGSCLESGLEEKCAVVQGFKLLKCLRALNTNFERREVFTAERCLVDLDCEQVCLGNSEGENEKFVVKRVAKVRISSSSFDCEAFNEKLRREFKVQSLLSELNHPGINKLSSYHEDENWIVAVSESAGEFDLVEMLQRVKRINENDCARMFRNAVEGLLAAHNFGISHRDVSLENLVFSEKTGSLQIIDWGHCVGSKTGLTKFHGVVGKERYFAPELVFRTDPEFEQNQDFYDPFKTDVFSLGVCLFSVLFGQMPFAKITDSRAECLKESVESLLQRLNLNSSENFVSRSAVSLLEMCLKWNPAERASLQQVLDHDFFKIK